MTSNELYIETKRLILREWKESDYQPFIVMNQDPLVMQYFLSVQTPGETLAFIERIRHIFATRGFGLFAVERHDTGEFIGYTGLSVPRFESFFNPCMEIGWRLAKQHWNNGFAQEAAKASLQFGFERHNLEAIYSFTSPNNLPSINVMKKIGMAEEGSFEHPLVPDGHPLKKHVLYKIEKKNWLERE